MNVAVRLRTRLCAALVVLGATAVACTGATVEDEADGEPVITISSIPDQNPEQLARRDAAMADYLAQALDVEVEVVPVADYAASVALFETGDLDLVFYGGLTGVQARQQVPDAVLVAQRDIDPSFRSVFIANADSGIEPIDSVEGLGAFTGTRFTFGSENSTSGRLMPEHFLAEAAISSADDFAGPPGYSGSHDKTIDLVRSGTYDGGVLNAQVWNARQETGDVGGVVEVFLTPTYHDYHWLASPDLDHGYGNGFTERLTEAVLTLHDQFEGPEVLAGYGAAAFIPTEPANYDDIEEIGRELGLVR